MYKSGGCIEFKRVHSFLIKFLYFFGLFLKKSNKFIVEILGKDIKHRQNKIASDCQENHFDYIQK